MRAHITTLHSITTFMSEMVLRNNIIIIGKATLKTPTLPCQPSHYAGHGPTCPSYRPQPPGQNHTQ